MGMKTLPLIVNVANFAKSGGFFEKRFSDRSRWNHFSTSAASVSSSNTIARIQTLAARWKGCRQAASYATKNKASIVFSHDPRVTYPAAIFLKLLGFRGKHVAYSFNYDALPSATLSRLHAFGFRYVDRFVVYSTMERHLYHERFRIPLEKIDFIHWGVNPPDVTSEAPPIENGDYICAIGGNSRDYATLVQAIHQLPDIRLVMVARPHNITGLTLPDNVSLRTNIPWSDAMNILAHSRFMVLPLAGSAVPCGHVTLVNAMHLKKAFIATQSKGIEDYALQHQNCLLVPAKDAHRMKDSIAELWRQPELCELLGERGQSFAKTHFTEACTQSYVESVLQSVGGFT
jgi:glycosyltransferase involved in cell wall biosynthesis